MYFVKQKEKMRKSIMAALGRGKVSKKRLLATLSLETGMTNVPILKLLADMEEVGLLNVEGDVISLGRKKLKKQKKR